MDPALLKAIHAHYLQDEDRVVANLHALAATGSSTTTAMTEDARALVEAVRARPDSLSPIERLLAEFDLTTSEGVLLMCLAETLLRVPDSASTDP